MPLPRAWFRNHSGELLIQFQHDRLTHNWRRVAPSDEYPHYDNLLPRFRDALQVLTEFVSQRGLGNILPTQCEVTYVNPLPLNDQGFGESLRRLIAPWTGINSDDFLPDPEVANLGLRYEIPSQSEERAGTLTITVEPRVSMTDKGTVVFLQLSALCLPNQQTEQGVVEALNLGHEWVINGFRSITTTDMHAAWGMKGNHS